MRTRIINSSMHRCPPEPRISYCPDGLLIGSHCSETIASEPDLTIRQAQARAAGHVRGGDTLRCPGQGPARSGCWRGGLPKAVPAIPFYRFSISVFNFRFSISAWTLKFNLTKHVL